MGISGGRSWRGGVPRLGAVERRAWGGEEGVGLKEAEGGAEADALWAWGRASGGGREAGAVRTGRGGQARRGRGLESGQKAEAG